MPFDSNGNASLVPGYLAVTGQTILASQHNPPLEDIASMLSQAILRSGVAPFSGNQSMAGFKITNAANGSSDGDYVTMSQLNAVIASVGTSAVPTGAVAGFRRAAAPSGWVIENGGTIGNATSNATTRANADTESLFTLLWTDFPALVIKTAGGVVTTRGASAAADFSANKQLTIHDSRTRFHRGSDSGLGYDTNIIVGLSQDDQIKTIPDVWLWTGVESTSGFDAGTNYTGRGSTQNRPAAWPSGSETRPRASAVLYCIKL